MSVVSIVIAVGIAGFALGVVIGYGVGHSDGCGETAREIDDYWRARRRASSGGER